jgi:2',3'-cyclic-nucleotide 2'-phosphodiesterase (5'-nucleotidase family)
MNRLISIFFPCVILLALITACKAPLDNLRKTTTLSSDDSIGTRYGNRVKESYVATSAPDTQMQVVVGHTDIPLTKAQPESTIGNFVADAQLFAAKKIDSRVVASVVNYGAIKLSYIPPGPITRGKLQELMPFYNRITIIEIPGEILAKFCDHMAEYRGWPMSGIRYTIVNKKAENITVGGAPVNDNIIYKLAVPDYLAKGGDNCHFLSGLPQTRSTVLVRTAIIDYVTHLQEQNLLLHPELESRISHGN